MFETYSKRSGSLMIFFLIVIASAITIGTIFTVVIYILANGVMHLSPQLFSLEYTAQKMSMLPAIITTAYIVVLF